MFEKLGNEPTLTDYDQEADLTNCIPGTGLYPAGLDPGNLISVGPPLNQGRYFIGIHNPSATQTATVFLKATLGQGSSANDLYTYSTNAATTLLDDAVTNASLFVPATQLVASVNVGMIVKTPRASDMTFTLVSPTGQRILLMENRGGTSTNDIGHLTYSTNFFGTALPGTALGNTNIIGPVRNSGILIINYDFYSLPDTLDVYYDGVDIFSSGLVNNSGQFTIPYGPGISSNLVIVMDKPGSGVDPLSLWTYTPTVVQEDYNYLTFTDDTNLATVPIKFAIPPYNLEDTGTNFSFCDFESATNGDYLAPTNIFDLFGGWLLPTNLVTITTSFNLASNQFTTVTNVVSLTNNLVSVVSDPSTAQLGSNYLALGLGTISRNLSFTVGRKYQVTYAYRGPGIAGWWRGEGNASDSSDPENNGNNGALVGRFNFPAGEVGQAFEMEDPGNAFLFGGTNTYVQIPQSSALDVGRGGGFTVEGWINPTNIAHAQPLVEWLAKVPTNAAVTNLVIVAGPVLNRATGHYYYLLGATNWTASEFWATQLGGHLVTLDTANEQNWVFDNFAEYGGVNRNLWIGLTNTLGTKFSWAGGSTNLAYTNWASGQPLNCDAARNFTFMFGTTNTRAGLWTLANNNGYVCNSAVSNTIYGVAEVDEIQTNGVQFWISVTNSLAGSTNTFVSSNGCLYANIVDTNFVAHEIVSAPGLVQPNIYQHVALTYNTNTGVAILYLNGTNVAVTNLGVFVPKTDGDILLGHDMTRSTNNDYSGRMDEMSLYNRALSDAEIAAIYWESATATNGLTGKFDPAITPAFGLAEASVSLGSFTNFIMGANNRWQLGGFTFTATTNSLPLQITGLQPGILLDSFTIAEAPQGNLYYQPEQPLASLIGDSAHGNWTLQVWDNRLNAFVTNLSQVVSWELNFVLQSNATIAAALDPLTPTASTVGAGQIVYYSVTVPAWAHYATNVLVSSDLPVDLLFNQTNTPTGSNPGDYTLLTAATSGSGTPVQAINGVPPAQLALLPGQTYYLGVRNNGAHAASVVLEVDYDITALTNGVPFTSVLNTNEYNVVRYFSYDVSSNAYAATFQLLKLSSNADLVLRKGVPLPTITNTDYGSFNVSNLDESIFVLTNSLPVPLSAGRWYLGVYKRDVGPVNFSVLAKELDQTNLPPHIIELTNGVPVNGTAGPGAALTNFFHFAVTNMVAGGVTNLGLRFELYNLTGDGDLNVQTNALPFAPPFFQSSQNSGRAPELILIHTNSALTNLVADWYLGVPNREITNINFTIVAVIETNAYFPAFPGASGSGGGAVGGRFGNVYHVINTSDDGPGSLRAAVNSAVTNRTVVFDITGTINLLSPLVITNSNLTIAGQTAPGGGITVAGDMTVLTGAHDVIIRDVRFRPGAGPDSLRFVNTSNIIADHVSASWSANALVSVLASTNVTVQWSILADSLYNTNNLLGSTNNPQGSGSRLRFGAGALSFNHNLYADNFSGNPQLGDSLSLDFVNNVIYNWGLFSGLSGATNDALVSTNGFTNQLNYVCNYLIAGPDTARFGTNFAITNIAFWGGATNTGIFQTNNFIDSNTNRILDGANTQWGMFANKYTKFEVPFSLLPVPTDEAFLAYEKVLDFAGVNMSLRDSVDAGIVTKVRNQTGTLITVPPVSGMVAWWKAENNTLDSVGTNNGVAQNITYTNGEVGQAFNFSGVNSSVIVPASSSLAVQSFTIEAWIYPTNVNTPRPIVEYSSPTGLGMIQLWYGDAGIGAPVPGGLHGVVRGGSGGGVEVEASAGTIPANKWTHVALTFDYSKLTIKIFVNGTNVGTAVSGAPFTQNTYVNVNLGYRPVGSAEAAFRGNRFAGRLDEVSIYNRPLSAAEIQSIYSAGSAGKFAAAVTPPIYLDTDQDGIPDFWESTFTPGLVFTPSNNNDRDGDGYTDLEEYNNWLAGPHALTVTNTPVGVDLQQLFGATGKLSFAATNGVNGLVYLTNVLGSVTNTGPFSNSIAVFTPTNNAAGGTNFYGYAAFDVYVTNNDTVAYFGPVTVRVLVSAVPIALNSNSPPVIIPLTNGVPYTNANFGGSDYYRYTVSSNGYGVYFELDNPSGPMALVARYGLPLPSLSSYDYYTNLLATPTNELIYIDTNSAPVKLQPGDWYLAAVNVSGSNVTYSAKATELSLLVPPVFLYPTNNTVFNAVETFPFSVSCLATDLDIPPLPLTFALVSGPTNMTVSTNGLVSWTPPVPGTNLIQISVANTNPLAINPKSYTVTNSFTVVVAPLYGLTNSVPQTNTIPPGGMIYYSVTVPTNAEFATNILLFATAPVNLLFNQTNLPAGTDFALLTNATNGVGTPSLGTNTVPPLVPGATYYLALQNTNAVAVNAGIEVVFRFLYTAVPFAFTQPATLIAGTSAQLNGIATANGLPSTAWFQWGTSTNYGMVTPPVPVISGYNVVTVTNRISGLIANLPYHFRLVVSNALGTAYGFDQFFDEANVWAWGADYVGQIDVPAGLSNVVAVAAAYDHSLALQNSGTVVAWGDDFFNQTNVPAGLTNVVAIAGGQNQSLALLADGTVAAWGGHFFGVTNVPAGLNHVVAIAGGQYYSLALKNDGTVSAWGANIFNLTNVPAKLNNVVAVAGGQNHILAVKNDGTVVTWGDNSAGQTNVPPGLSNVVAVAGGSYHSLALKGDGTVVAWGDNSSGQTNVPAGLSNVVGVAAGGFHSLALKNDGTIVPWGDNSAGQTNLPAGLTNVLSISAGYFHSLALASAYPLNHTNSPPFWTNTLANQTVNELSNLTVNAQALDTNVPAVTLTYALANAPAGMTLNTNSGLINWTPTEAQGPGIYSNITVVVTDNSTPPLSATNRFTVTVNEVNTAPFWPTNVPGATNFVINALSTLVVTNAASDSDIPANPLSYTLTVSGGVTNAAISGAGIITWTPGLAQVSSNYTFTTIVTDTNAYALTNQSLSATNTFTVTVLPPLNLTNSTPQTNLVAAGGIDWYLINVPTNADFATNQLVYASAPVTLWFSTNQPPTTVNTGDFILLATATNGLGSPVLGTNTTPPLVPGSTYYLGAQNNNATAASVAVAVDFHYQAPLPTNAITIASIVTDTNGVTLQWTALAGEQFQVQWATNLTSPVTWTLFTNIITSPNTVFTFTDTNTPALLKFYQLLLLP